MRRGALVLGGGRSTRMGRDKATLPFGAETLLQRVVRIVAARVHEVVVVARTDQPLPPLPADVRVAHDEVEDRGPLGGLVPGLRATRAEAVFATACDVPFLRGALVDLLFERLGAHDVAIARAEGYLHPLAAVYRRDVLPALERMLAAGRLRPVHLLEEVDGIEVDEATLRLVDPDLRSLANLNAPADYEAALARLAAEPPCVRVELYEVARRLAGVASLEVSARTLGEALREAARAHPSLEPRVIRGDRLAPHWRANLGGRLWIEDPGTPLVDGDAVVLVSALAGG